jgi:hypothetical protein
MAAANTAETLADAWAPISGYLLGRWFTSGQAGLVGSKRGSRFFGENRTNALANDRIFAGLQHPYPNHERVCIRWNTLVGFLSRVRVQLDRRLPAAQSLDDLVSGDASDLRVEAYEEMWNVVGDLQAPLFPF